jgi:hypothetical protein
MSVDGPASDALQQAMATIGQKFESLGRPDLIRGMVIENYPGGRDGKCTNYTAGPKRIKMVTMCGSKNHMRNVTAADISLSMIHEFFHAAGQQKYYGSYQGSVPVCEVTGYCTHSDNRNPRNEEFAEVGAMYVHSPQVLKSTCPEAYEFFKNNIFNGHEASESTCQGIATAIAGSPDGGAPANAGRGVAGDVDASQILQLAAAMSPILNKAEEKKPTEPSPAVTVIQKGATSQQCNLNSSQCPGTTAR